MVFYNFSLFFFSWNNFFYFLKVQHFEMEERMLYIRSQGKTLRRYMSTFHSFIMVKSMFTINLFIFTFYTSLLDSLLYQSVENRKWENLGLFIYLFILRRLSHQFNNKSDNISIFLGFGRNDDNHKFHWIVWGTTWAYRIFKYI